MTPLCLYFGCWNEAGHYLWLPGKRSAGREYQYRKHEYARDGVHLDGALAPVRTRDGQITFTATGQTMGERQRLSSRTDECPQGQFLLHHLPSGMTAIQWWDRNQGDRRGACNSTILLEGEHTATEMVAALGQHFPHVAANLAKAGVVLVEVSLK